MLARCFNPNSTSYGNYGGRDDPLTVHEYYRDFQNWYADIGFQLHDKHLSQDRINNDRGYEPGNVRAADASMQRANQRGRPRGER
jgi:hypothetical protein